MSSFSLVVLGLICSVQSGYQNVELSRIKYYELVNFDIDLTNSNLFEFSAFNHTYKMELIRNEDMVPSNIKRSHGVSMPKHDETNAYFSSLTESCHYFGKVLNDNEDRLQRVALSLCPKRGVRGEIRAFNETILIKPSKYYLDPQYDGDYFHDIDDEHLVWRYSDLDTKGIPEAKGIDIDTPDIDTIKSRRRTICSGGCNNGKNRVELYVAVDPSQIAYFKKVYSGSWYEQVYSDTADYVNVVSSKYTASSADFKAYGIGTISVHFVEFEVISSYTGSYASLSEGCKSSESGWPCNKDPNMCECTINGVTYLNKFNTFLKNYKDENTFDNAQLISKKYFDGAAGWAQVGTVCRSHSTAVISSVYGDAYDKKAGAHELGHNFGARHDGEKKAPTCSTTAGIMGTGSVYDGWSSCSLSAMRDYFFNNNGLTCLGNGVRSFTSNYDDNGGGNADDECSYYNCIQLANIGGLNQMMTTYSPNGCHNGEAQYKASNGNYYVFKAATGNWYLSNAVSEGSPKAYCSKSDIMQCSNQWGYWDSSSKQWTRDSSSSTWECSGAFTMNANDCNNEQSDVVCITDSHVLSVGTEWQLMDGVCENDNGVYYAEDDAKNTSYYLYYTQYKQYTDDTETYGKWVISVDEILGLEYAFCDESVLTDCVSGEWYSFDAADDAISLVKDDVISVYDCPNEKSKKSWFSILIFVLLICILLFISIGLYLYCRYSKATKHMKQMEIGEESDHEVEEEIEVNVEVATLKETN